MVFLNYKIIFCNLHSGSWKVPVPLSLNWFAFGLAAPFLRPKVAAYDLD